MNITNTNEPLQPDSALLGAEQCSVLLGVSVATLRRLAVLPGFPAPIHLGRLVRWDRDAVLTWARSRADGLLISPEH